MAKQYLIQSRAVSQLDIETGKRLPHHQTYWGKWQNWVAYDSPIQNFKDAIANCRYATQVSHQGYVIYARLLRDGKMTSNVQRIYQIKWGNNNVYFEDFTEFGRILYQQISWRG